MWLLSSRSHSRHRYYSTRALALLRTVIPFDHFHIRPDPLDLRPHHPVSCLNLKQTSKPSHPSHTHLVFKWRGVSTARSRAYPHSVMINPGPISGSQQTDRESEIAPAYLPRGQCGARRRIVCLLYFDRNAKCCGLVRRLLSGRSMYTMHLPFGFRVWVDQKMIDTMDLPKQLVDEAHQHCKPQCASVRHAAAFCFVLLSLARLFQACDCFKFTINSLRAYINTELSLLSNEEYRAFCDFDIKSQRKRTTINSA